MPDLSFRVEGVEVTPFTAAPLLTFRLRTANAAADEVVHSVVLRAQIMLEVTRRHYSAEEEARLQDLFGGPERWGRTLRPMLWTHANAVVPRFTGETMTDLPVGCTYDFNVAATKYFYGLTGGEVPLDFLFSGSVFYEDEGGALQVAPISWTKEARYRLPIATWQELMDVYYPNQATLTLRGDVFERLYRYKMDRGIPTWEAALEGLLPPVNEEARV